MRHIVWIFALLASLHIEAAWGGPNGQATAPQNNYRIRVLIAHDIPEASLEVIGPYAVVDPADGSVLTKQNQGKRRTVSAKRAGVKWGEEFPGIYQVKILPQNREGLILLNGVPYAGSLYVYDIGDNISIVNEVNIEDYVASVLTNRLSQPLPEEAMAAVAITERTDAYYRMLADSSRYWDVDGNLHHYAGVRNLAHRPFVEQIVLDTSGMVMTRPNDEGGLPYVFPAFWGPSDTTTPRSEDQHVLIVDNALRAANEGAHAGEILRSAFPRATIQRPQR